MKRKLGLMTIVVGALLAIPVQATAECYMDTPSGYGSIGGASRIGPYPDRSSCESVNSQSFGGRGSCSCSSSGTSSGSGSTAYSNNPYTGTMNQMMLNTMQGLMNNFMTGYQRGLEIQRQRAIQQQQENERRQHALRLQMQERERLYKEKEKRHRQEFEMAKKRMLGQMRGLQTPSLQSRKLAPLEVRETDGGAFGIKTLKPRDLSQSKQLASAAPSPNAWLKRANCSAHLLQGALRNWSDENFEEAAYLSNEAAALASGEKSSPAVVCPPLPNVPDVKGEQTPEDKAKAEKFMKHTMLVSKLFTKAAKQMKDYTAMQHSSSQAKQKMDEAKARKEEAEAKMQAIESEQQQEAEAKKASVMAEALAAMKKAKEALALSEKNLADAKQKQEEMEKRMKDTRDMFQTARNNPDKTDDLINQLSKAPKKKD